MQTVLAKFRNYIFQQSLFLGPKTAVVQVQERYTDHRDTESNYFMNNLLYLFSSSSSSFDFSAFLSGCDSFFFGFIRTTQQVVVLKLIPKKHWNVEETQILKKLSHCDNIIKLLSWFRIRDSTDFEYALVFPYYPFSASSFFKHFDYFHLPDFMYQLLQVYIYSLYYLSINYRFWLSEKC